MSREEKQPPSAAAACVAAILTMQLEYRRHGRDMKLPVADTVLTRLQDAERVDPQIFNTKPLCNFNGVEEGAREIGWVDFMT